MKLQTTTWDTTVGWSALPAVDSPSTLVLLFGDVPAEVADGALADLSAALPRSIVVGGSTAGQIVGPLVCDDGCVAVIARFDDVPLRRAVAEIDDPSRSYDAGVAIGDQLIEPDLRAVFVMSDGIGVNGGSLVAGIAATVGPNVSITGGLAGDGDRFEQTWVVDGSRVRSDVVVAVGLYGPHVEVASGSYGGWGIFGPERVVTRAVDNVLYELDGQPALEIYKRYLGELAVGLPANALLFPLAVRPADGGEQLVRTVLGVDEDEQSMTFAGDIPSGWTAQLMRSNVDRLVDGAESAAQLASDGFAPPASGAEPVPTLGIAVSCVGRRLVLGARTDEELEALADALPPGTELVGFYSYGEIAPRHDGVADLHNQTMTVTAIREVP